MSTITLPYILMLDILLLIALPYILILDILLLITLPYILILDKLLLSNYTKVITNLYFAIYNTSSFSIGLPTRLDV